MCSLTCKQGGTSEAFARNGHGKAHLQHPADRVEGCTHLVIHLCHRPMHHDLLQYSSTAFADDASITNHNVPCFPQASTAITKRISAGFANAAGQAANPGTPVSTTTSFAILEHALCWCCGSLFRSHQQCCGERLLSAACSVRL